MQIKQIALVLALAFTTVLYAATSPETKLCCSDAKCSEQCQKGSCTKDANGNVTCCKKGVDAKSCCDSAKCEHHTAGKSCCGGSACKHMDKSQPGA